MDKRGESQNIKNPVSEDEKERRVLVSMLRIWVKKYRTDFHRIAEEDKLNFKLESIVNLSN